MGLRRSYEESSYYKTIEVVSHDDRLLCSVKQHPFALLIIYILTFVAFTFALVLISIYIPKNSIDTSSLYKAWTLLAFIIGLLLIGILTAVTFMYNKTSLTVTNKNVIQVMQKSLYERKIAHISLANIEDVTSEQRGLFANSLNFGTLKIETAGDHANFIFQLCPHPNRVARIILDAKNTFIHETGKSGSFRNDIQLRKAEKRYK